MARKKLKKAQNKFDKWFLLSWRKLWIVVVTGFVSIILHNLIFALFNVEEAFFFIIVVFLLPLYFIIMILYTIINKIKRR
ncbi:MAG: hypothetical protein KKG94_03465 [Nanoarchaeota archaeon]|nr:hypothetical protein [Nanoarchaeota archaeon]